MNRRLLLLNASGWAAGSLLSRSFGSQLRLQSKPVILSISTVYKHPHEDPYDLQNRFGFNHGPSVVLLPDERLLAAWFSGPFEASVHQAILGCYSSDGGQSWGPGEVLNDFPRTSDFDPAFIADGKRTWFFFSAGRWNRYPFARGDNAIGAESFKIFHRYTDDSGRSWSESQLAFEKCGCRSNGIKLSSGELLLPIYGFVKRSSGVLKSSDAGKTWNRFGDLSTPAGSVEPTIAELSSGAVVMFLRTGDGLIWRSLSKDKGENWSIAEKTEIVAGQSSHHLLRLRDGRLVLTHNASPPPNRTPLTLRVSVDDGASWGDPLKLAEIAVPGKDEAIWGRQVTYPSVVELADGTLVVVWAELILGNSVQFGDIRSARVRV